MTAAAHRSMPLRDDLSYPSSAIFRRWRALIPRCRARLVSPDASGGCSLRICLYTSGSRRFFSGDVIGCRCALDVATFTADTYAPIVSERSVAPSLPFCRDPDFRMYSANISSVSWLYSIPPGDWGSMNGTRPVCALNSLNHSSAVASQSASAASSQCSSTAVRSCAVSSRCICVGLAANLFGCICDSGSASPLSRKRRRALSAGASDGGAALRLDAAVALCCASDGAVVCCEPVAHPLFPAAVGGVRTEPVDWGSAPQSLLCVCCTVVVLRCVCNVMVSWRCVVTELTPSARCSVSVCVCIVLCLGLCECGMWICCS